MKSYVFVFLFSIVLLSGCGRDEDDYSNGPKTNTPPEFTGTIPSNAVLGTDENPIFIDTGSAGNQQIPSPLPLDNTPGIVVVTPSPLPEMGIKKSDPTDASLNGVVLRPGESIPPKTTGSTTEGSISNPQSSPSSQKGGY